MVKWALLSIVIGSGILEIETTTGLSEQQCKAMLQQIVISVDAEASCNSSDGDIIKCIVERSGFITPFPTGPIVCKIVQRGR